MPNLPTTQLGLSRLELGELFTSRNYLVGVEVGVQQGIFAEQLLKTWPGKLHLVDTYKSFPKEEYNDIANVSAVQHSEYFTSAVKRLCPYSTRIQWHLKDANLVASSFPDYSLDFVYLDANHSEMGIASNITAWLRKIRFGGMLLGHDYDARFPAVIKVAHRTAEALKQPLFITNEPVWATWGIERTWPGKGVILQAGTDGRRTEKATNNAEDLLLLTHARHRKWAAEHGADFLSLTGSLFLSYSPHWTKIKLLHQALETYDWAVWLDADTIVMDLSASPVDMLPKSGTIALAPCGMGFNRPHLNSGVIAATAPAQEFLARVLQKGPIHIESPIEQWAEQNTIHKLLETQGALVEQMDPRYNYSSCDAIKIEGTPIIRAFHGIPHREGKMREVLKTCTP